MKVAAAYIRVSTDDQVEYSPKSQIKAIKKYAEKNSFFFTGALYIFRRGNQRKKHRKKKCIQEDDCTCKNKTKAF